MIFLRPLNYLCLSFLVPGLACVLKENNSPFKVASYSDVRPLEDRAIEVKTGPEDDEKSCLAVIVKKGDPYNTEDATAWAVLPKACYSDDVQQGYCKSTRFKVDDKFESHLIHL